MIDRLLGARLYVIAVFVSILAVAAFAAKDLAIDSNNRVFFSEDHEHYSNLIDLEDKFGSNTNLLYLIVSNDSLFDGPHLASAIRWLTDEAWRIERVTSVDSVATYPHISGSKDQFFVDNLLDYICPLGESCKADRSDALRKPYLLSRLVSLDGRAFAVVADVDLHEPSSNDVTDVARQSAQLQSEFESRFPSFSLHLTGGVPMMQAFFDAAERDSQTLIVLAVIILAVGLYLFLGGVIPTLLMLLLGMSSVLVALGFAGWSGFVINTATATVPLIVLTLVLASAMHIFLHIVREEGMGSRQGVINAVRASVSANWRPVALTSGTTIVGLLSMLSVSAPPIRELGVLASVGVFAGAVFSLTAIPCLFTYLPRLRLSSWLRCVQGAMNRYARWLEHTRPNMWVVGIVFLVGLAGLGRTSIDEDFVRYFAPDTDFRRNTEVVTERLASPYHVDVVYDSGSTSGIYSERSIQELRDLAAFIQADARVVSVASVINVLEQVAKIMSGSGELLGRTSSELAQYFLSYELSLGMGQSGQDLIDSDHRRARLSILFNDVSMAEIRQFDQTLQKWAVSEGSSKRVTVTGEGIPTAYLSSESIKEVGVGIIISIAISAVLLGFYFFDIRAGISVLSAMVVPILAGFGMWSWIEPEIGMAATLVVAVTIGVVIDDTIHLTYRYVDSVKNLDLTSWGAIAFSVHKTGTAILVTSVVLVAGFLVLVGSQFRMNSTFGVCSSMIIFLALVYNMTIAPHFLARFGSRQDSKVVHVHEEGDSSRWTA